MLQATKLSQNPRKGKKKKKEVKPTREKSNKTHLQTAANHAINGIVASSTDTDDLNLGRVHWRKGTADAESSKFG